jgi:tellurite resistance protein TerC
MDVVASLFLADWLGKPVWAWVAFFSIVLALLAFDLGILHKDDREMGVSESLWLSAFYIGFAMIFGIGVWLLIGPQSGLEYFTGFFIEKSLSIDNVFVISMIFGYFAIPTKYQYRALVWGIIGVVILRGLMIAAGAALVERFDWILMVFAAFLIITGIRMMFQGESHMDIAKNPIVILAKRWLRVSPELHGERFFVRKLDATTGKKLVHATPLFLALLVINVADIIFAVDSVPAIFAITQDPYIVYTANIMAILGLRALYFALAAMVNRFHYLKYALALVLVFIGTKIFAADLLGLDKIPAWFSLGVTFALIGGGIVFSLYKTRGQASGGPTTT